MTALSFLFFQVDPPVVLLGGALFLTLLVMLWGRHRRVKKLLSQEGFKLLAAALVWFLFFQPATRQRAAPSASPKLVILKDHSPSMQTEDEEQDGVFLTRRQTMEDFLSSDLWQDFKEKSEFEVVEMSFSSPRGEATNLSRALGEVLEGQEDLRRVLLLSDGDWNEGEHPTQTALRFRKAQIPLDSLGVGQAEALPDVATESLTAPSTVKVGERLELSAWITSTRSTQTEVEVELSRDAEPLSRQMLTLPPFGRRAVRFTTRLSQAGPALFELRALTSFEEVNQDNNQKSLSVLAQEERLQVLLIDTLPRWEYRFIRNALMRDPSASVDCLLLHPDLPVGEGENYLPAFPSAEELQRYDVFFLGDLGMGPGELSAAQIEELVKQVQRYAAGIVFLPGPRGQQTSLMESAAVELLPVRYTEEARGVRTPITSTLELSERGRQSLLTLLSERKEQNALLWRSLPGFQWYQGGVQAKAGTDILAFHPSEGRGTKRLPLIVAGSSGRGKTLYMGVDSAWKWRRGYEELYHYRYWSQIARWMAYQRKRAGNAEITLFFSPERPVQNEPFLVRANGFTPTGAPAQHAAVTLRLTSPEGVVQLESLPATQNWGEYQNELRLTEAGPWNLRASFEQSPSSLLETTLDVQRLDAELPGRPAQPALLESLAALTQGEFQPLSRAPELLSALQSLPVQQSLVTLRPLAEQGWYALLILSALTAHWIQKKRLL